MDVPAPTFRRLACALLLLIGACDDNTTSPVVPPGPNRAPTVALLPDTTVILADTLRGRVAASDPDGDRLVYKMTVLLRDASELDYVPAAHIDSTSGRFWFLPGPRDRPDRSILFTVIDEHGYPASAQLDLHVTYYIDQSSGGYGGGNNATYYAPMGQEFTPAFSALDVVELMLEDASGSTLPGRIAVRIRDGTIAGTVVAESDTLTLPDNFRGTVMFRFARVPLQPQNRYVLEIVPVSSSFLAERDGNGYAGGRLILSGQVQERSDLWFKEGALSPPPPEVPPEAAVAREP